METLSHSTLSQALLNLIRKYDHPELAPKQIAPFDHQSIVLAHLLSLRFGGEFGPCPVITIDEAMGNPSRQNLVISFFQEGEDLRPFIKAGNRADSLFRTQDAEIGVSIPIIKDPFCFEGFEISEEEEAALKIRSSRKFDLAEVMERYSHGVDPRAVIFLQVSKVEKAVLSELITWLHIEFGFIPFSEPRDIGLKSEMGFEISLLKERLMR